MFWPPHLLYDHAFSKIVEGVEKCAPKSIEIQLHVLLCSKIETTRCLCVTGTTGQGGHDLSLSSKRRHRSRMCIRPKLSCKTHYDLPSSLSLWRVPKGMPASITLNMRVPCAFTDQMALAASCSMMKGLTKCF
jgi:hypothetical protein